MEVKPYYETTPKRVFSLLLGLNVATFILTVIPVVKELPQIANYYWADDILRLLEPLIALPLQLLILLESPLVMDLASSRRGNP